MISVTRCFSLSQFLYATKLDRRGQGAQHTLVTRSGLRSYDGIQDRSATDARAYSSLEVVTISEETKQ